MSKFDKAKLSGDCVRKMDIINESSLILRSYCEKFGAFQLESRIAEVTRELLDIAYRYYELGD